MKQQKHLKKQAAGKQSQKNHKPAMAANIKADSLKWKLGLLVAAVGFIVCVNTLGHQYVLDDYSLILENTITQQGTKALPEIFKTSYRSGYFNADYQLYRPLSKAMFAIEWQLSPHKPFLGHLVNVMLYALTGFVLFRVLTMYFNDSSPSPLPNGRGINAYAIPLIASLLFITHPIHTEVVANIKSRDELLSFLFFLLTAWSVYKNKTLLAGITFFLALLSKESAITYLAVIPLMLYFSTKTLRQAQGDMKSYKVPLIALAGVTVVFLLIRQKVLGNVEAGTAMIDNYLVGIKDFAMQKATAIMLMGVYLLKLFFPHPLVSDGSFNYFPTVGIGDWRFLLSAAVYIGLIVIAVRGFKRKQLLSFSIIYFLIAASLTSNIVFTIGTNYGERLMYAPSLGFCLAIALLINKFPKVPPPKGDKYIAFFLTGIIVIAYSAKAIARNGDWHDNLTLYTEDVKTADKSARTHFYLGNHITQEDFINEIKDSTERMKYMQLGITELQKAIDIYPSYADAYHKIAKTYMQMKDYQKSEPLYLKALSLNPNEPTFLNNYGNLLFNTGRYNEAKEKFERAVQYNPYYAHAYNNLASVYGTLGQYFASQGNQKAALENFNNAIFYFKKAIKVDPSFPQPYALLSMTYKNVGDQQNSDYYNQQYQRLLQK